MDTIVNPCSLNGEIKAISSKSDVHRLLICAALADKPSQININGISKDISATVRCLNALGASISAEESIIHVKPVKAPIDKCVLDCGESGSTLRFMLPIAAALGVNAEFIGSGRLPLRPIGELTTVLEEHGICFSSEKLPFAISGKLSGGVFRLPGNISSQYITGIMLALPIIGGGIIELTSRLQSSGYVELTQNALNRFGAEVRKTLTGFEVQNSRYISEGVVNAEGDWSNAAFFLAAGAINGNVTINGLNMLSSQTDKRIVEILKEFGANVAMSDTSVTVKTSELKGTVVDVSDIPDLLPVLSVTAAYADGRTEFKNAARLRLKESDRLKTTADMINSLGGRAEEHADGLTVYGTGLCGGKVNGCNDHRIVMSAAAAACGCSEKVTIIGSEAVAKSYPAFFEDYSKLGGECNAV